MFSSSQTAAGSIRECNQDAILVDKNFRFAVIIDGKGINGTQASDMLANVILLRLKENSYLFSAFEVKKRILQVLEQSVEEIEEKYPGSFAGMALVWVHAGVVGMVQAGRCRIMASAPSVFETIVGKEDYSYAEHLAEANNHYLLTSEGFAFSFSEKKLKNLIKDFILNFSKEKLQNFWTEAADIYDGDDRSLVFLTLDKADLDVGKKREIELFTDIDRQFSFPVWLPVSIVGALGIFGLFVSRKLLAIFKNIVPSNRFNFFD
jgi:hypothetical protein